MLLQRASLCHFRRAYYLDTNRPAYPHVSRTHHYKGGPRLHSDESVRHTLAEAIRREALFRKLLRVPALCGRHHGVVSPAPERTRSPRAARGAWAQTAHCFLFQGATCRQSEHFCFSHSLWSVGASHTAQHLRNNSFPRLPPESDSHDPIYFPVRSWCLFV